LKKYNQKYLKSRNQGRVLELLYFKGPKSRAQLSKDMGIVRSTASEIVNELLELYVINEGNKINGSVGKRPTLLHFNKNLFYFIAIVITSNTINTTLCNLKGEILNELLVNFSEDLSAKKIIELAFRNIDKVVSGINSRKLILISVGSPETISKETGIIKWAPYIHDWVGINLKSVFMDRYKTDVILKDHVKLETFGEQWKSFSHISNMVYIVITKGIGSGVIIDGKIREGKNGYLGEIGFLPIYKQLDSRKNVKEIHGLGPFESQCDIINIEKTVNEYLINNRLIKNKISFESIIQYYKTNPEVKEFIHKEILEVLALGIASVVIVLDPEIVVINGEIILFGEEFLGALREKVYSMVPYRTEIVYSQLRDRSKIYGAIRNGLIYIEDQLFKHTESFLERLSKSK